MIGSPRPWWISCFNRQFAGGRCVDAAWGTTALEDLVTEAGRRPDASRSAVAARVAYAVARGGVMMTILAGIGVAKTLPAFAASVAPGYV